jgi:hypothetical protein
MAGISLNLVQFTERDKVGKPICRPSSSNFSSWYGAMDLSICSKLKDLDSMQLMALPYINGITKCKKDRLMAIYTPSIPQELERYMEY